MTPVAAEVDEAPGVLQHVAAKAHALRLRVRLWTAAIWVYPVFAIVFWFQVMKHTVDWPNPANWISMLMIPILTVGFPALHLFREEHQLEHNRLHAWLDERPFFLVLRSFTNPRLQHQIQKMGRTAGEASFLEYIDDALSPLGGIVYIGGMLSYVTQVGGKAPNAVVLQCEDENWRRLFETFRASCRAIVLLPQTSQGVVEEMTMLRDTGLFAKTIIAVPPAFHFKNSESEWSRIADDLAEAGFALPPYVASGAVFIPDAHLGPARMIEFTDVWREKQMVRNAVEELLAAIPGEGVPLKTAMWESRELLPAPLPAGRWPR